MSLDYRSELEKKEDEDLICGCCEKTRELTPAKIENPAGLSSIIYRVGTFATFKESMLECISSAENALSRLTTRSDDDFIIALIDAWSMVLDVLTFYQERIATEGFLRTATERISILELARTIGYELGPGVAASTFLAFNLEVDPDEDAQRPVLINKLTKVQSLPAQGQMPQVFENIEDIVAWPEWNELKPRLTELQDITENTSTFYFSNLKTHLKAGDGVLVFLDGSL